MTTKKTAQELGVNIVDSSNTLNNAKHELLTNIKKILPNVINSDGILDTKALNDLVDIANTTANNQGYELTFAGKGIAKAKADKPTTKELKLEPKQSKDFDNTENVIIRGDNLDVLKILYANYHHKIKMIYIDPPYNTKSENFIYNDNFKETEDKLIEEYGLGEETANFLHNVYGTQSHSGWLSFMYPRLKLARDLLTDDGVIFISIDDNEQANLKLICDEIFGEDNVEIMIWHKIADDSGKMKVTHRFRREHENILVCYKNRENVFFDKYLSERNYKNTYTNPDNDYRGAYKQGIISSTEEKSNKQGKNFFSVTTPSGKLVSRQWRFTKEEFDALDKDNRIYYGKQGDSIPSLKVFINEPKATTPMSILYNLGTAKVAGTEIENLLGNRKIFTNPKPTSLISYLVEIARIESDLILDFFAGSGTTADAVMQLNAEDGGRRKFILVQWDEEIDTKKSKEAYDFCQKNKLEPVISSICIERVNRAGEKIKNEEADKNKQLKFEEKPKTCPDIGYKVFSLTEKPDISYLEENNELELVHERPNSINTLYNMLVATCKPLHTKIETLKKDMMYKADNEIYILGNVKPDDLQPYKSIPIHIDAYSGFKLKDYLNLGIGDKENIRVIF